MTPTIYVGDHQHARVVCSAFAEGCGGKLVPADSALRPGPAAMWGILRGAGDRIKDCEVYGHPYFYIDHGYFRRGHYDGHYRVVFCDRHLQGPPQPSDGKRWEALGYEIQPRRREFKTGDPVIYLPVSRHVAAFRGFDPEAYDASVLETVRIAYGTSITVCEKAEETLQGELHRAGIVIGTESNALLEAALEGVNTLEFGYGPANYVKHRPELFRWLADNQWTLEEMRSGKCWSDLMERHGSALESLAA